MVCVTHRDEEILRLAMRNLICYRRILPAAVMALKAERWQAAREHEQVIKIGQNCRRPTGTAVMCLCDQRPASVACLPLPMQLRGTKAALGMSAADTPACMIADQGQSR